MSNQTDLTKFAEVLRQKIDESLYATDAAFARASKTSKQNVSRILTLRRHWNSNAPPTVERETVLKWATTLNWDVNEALLLSGHAPEIPPSLYDETLLSIAGIFQNLSFPESKDKARFLFELLEREMLRIKEEDLAKSFVKKIDDV